MNIASLCVLAYKRPFEFERCLQSLQASIDYPCEIIVNVDGGEEGNIETRIIAEDLFNQGLISKLIFNNGKNRGVGRSLQNCIGIAEGNYIVKVDTDLTFHPKWLSTGITVLQKYQDIGCISFFDYRNYDPKDERFNHLEDLGDCFMVDDFVSSIFMFRSNQLDKRRTIPDDGMHQWFGKMAITHEDFVSNSGFGLGKSTYVVPDSEGNPVKAETYSEPLVFPKE